MFIPGNISLTNSRPDTTLDPKITDNKYEDIGAQATSSNSPNQCIMILKVEKIIQQSNVPNNFAPTPGSKKDVSPIKSMTKHATNVTYADDGISSLGVSREGAAVFVELTGLFKLKKKSLANLMKAAAAMLPRTVPISRELKVWKNALKPSFIASCCVVIVCKVLESEKSVGTRYCLVTQRLGKVVLSADALTVSNKSIIIWLIGCMSTFFSLCFLF